MDKTSPAAALKTRLLVVDDRPENLIALEAVLGSDDYVLYSARSGPEALEALEKHEVDLILLDIQMPGMDGYEVAQRIKKMERCAEIPIIFITAIYTEDPHIKKGYAAGAVDYFSKPFDPDILKMKIAIYASVRQKQALLKEKERRLRESEELLKTGRKLSAVLETLPVGVIIADTGGGVVQTNDTVLRIWRSETLVENDSYGEFLEWWSHEGKPVKDAFLQVLRGGKSTHNQIIPVKCFDGTVKSILSSVSPLRGTAHQIVGAVAVIQDVTEQREVENDMEQRIMKLVTLGVELEHSLP